MKENINNQGGATIVTLHPSKVAQAFIYDNEQRATIIDLIKRGFKPHHTSVGVGNTGRKLWSVEKYKGRFGQGFKMITKIMAHPNLEQFFTDKVGMNLKQYMTSYVIDNTSVEELVNELDLQHSRCCSECGKPMYEGFCIEDGADYYCSEECLYKHLSEEEYNQLYDEERGNSYWTSWID